jgi:hypothetical protein
VRTLPSRAGYWGIRRAGAIVGADLIGGDVVDADVLGADISALVVREDELDDSGRACNGQLLGLARGRSRDRHGPSALVTGGRHRYRSGPSARSGHGIVVVEPAPRRSAPVEHAAT